MAQLFFNILAIVGAAAFSGVMICIGITLGGYWRSLPPEIFIEWFTVNSHFVARSIPVVFLPALVGLAGSLWLAWRTPLFIMWVVSILCLMVTLLLTVSYFVPANNLFASGEMQPGIAVGKLEQWLFIHNLRIAFAMLSAVFGIVAIAGRV